MERRKRAVSKEVQGLLDGPLVPSSMLQTVLDTYVALDKVGEGTFSTVHKARRESDGSVVAIKRLKKVEQAASRIRDEVGCLFALQGCDHIATILDCWRHNGQVDIVMPCADRTTQTCACSPVPAARTVALPEWH